MPNSEWNGEKAHLDGDCPSQAVQQAIPEEEIELNPEVPASTENDCAKSQSSRVTWMDFVFPFASMALYLYDFGSDVHLAYLYFSEGSNWYFALTVLFLLVPEITTSVLSSVWYWKDRKKQNVCAALWALRVTFAVLLLSPFLRYCECLFYAVASRKAEKKKKAPTKQISYMLMTVGGADVALLRLFEGFMEAAPQLVLQLYILARRASDILDQEGTLSINTQSVKIALSPLSLAIAMMCFHRNKRRAESDAQEISLWASFFHFIAFLFITSSRVLAISLFPSISTWHLKILAVGVAAHWFLMLILILKYNPTVFENWIGNFGFSLVFAAIHIFTFVNTKEGNTRYRYIIFYAICFLEDTVLMVFWFLATDPSLWFRVPALVGYFVAFVVGVVLLGVYHLFLHPVTKRKYALDICGQSPATQME